MSEVEGKKRKKRKAHGDTTFSVVQLKDAKSQGSDIVFNSSQRFFLPCHKYVVSDSKLCVYIKQNPINEKI